MILAIGVIQERESDITDDIAILQNGALEESLGHTRRPVPPESSAIG